MYQRIMVVLAGDSVEQKALSRAITLAKAQPASLTLFLSIYDFAYEMTTMLSSDEREQMRQSLIQDRRQWVIDLLEDYDLKGIDYNIDIVWHHRPFESIIQHALEHRHELIIKGTRQHKTFQSVIFTPTDWSLLRKAPCPVLLVKDHEWRENGSIITAVHAASDSKTHQKLNRKLITHAAFISNKVKAKLHLINFFPGAPTAIAVEIPDFNTQQYKANVESFHQNAMQELVADFDTVVSSTYTREGIPDDGIPAIAKELDAELVVLGTIGRTGISAALLGNTAEHVIEQLDCDLLAIKPDGFKSPLQK